MNRWHYIDEEGNYLYKPRFARVDTKTGACFESDSGRIQLELSCQHYNHGEK